MTPPVSQFEQIARSRNAWFDVDRAPNDPATTAWKRAARLHQANWRDARGLPIGAHPYAGGDMATPVGSRLALTDAVENGANFLSAAALAAVKQRLAHPERHQTLSDDRLWADLLSSMPLCFNLFGYVFADDRRACDLAQHLSPGTTVRRASLRFEHSPGRLDPQFLGNRSAFDAAVDVEDGDGVAGIIGIETKYHEHTQRAAVPKPERLARYVEVTERSGVFRPDWRDAVLGTELQQLWLDHLLMLAMLQHPSGRWRWGRFVLVSPARNPSFARAAERYGDVLEDAATFGYVTVEEVLHAPGLMPDDVRAAFSRRYLDFAP